MSDTINETNIKSKKQKVDKYNGFKVPSRTRKNNGGRPNCLVITLFLEETDLAWMDYSYG